MTTKTPIEMIESKTKIITRLTKMKTKPQQQQKKKTRTGIEIMTTNTKKK